MRHAFDPWSLLLGLFFAAVAMTGLAGGLERFWNDADLWTPQTLVPAALILLGLLVGGFASAMLRRRALLVDTRAPADDGHDPADAT